MRYVCCVMLSVWCCRPLQEDNQRVLGHYLLKPFANWLIYVRTCCRGQVPRSVVQVKAYRGVAGTHPFYSLWAAVARKAPV